MNQPTGGAPAPRPVSPVPQPGGRPATPPASPRRKASAGLYVRLGIVALIIIFALVFVFQNTRRVALQFLSANFTAPLWLMLLIVLVLGVIVGYGLGWLQFRRHKSEQAARKS